MGIAIKLLLELGYALMMLGVPLDGPALMLGDNMLVVLNTTVPSSVLKKKHLGIGHHRHSAPLLFCFALILFGFVGMRAHVGYSGNFEMTLYWIIYRYDDFS